MKLRIITFIGYSNIHTVKDITKQLSCNRAYLDILKNAGILTINKPHDIVILTKKGSDIYKMFNDILNLVL